MKKTLAIILALLSLLSLVACGSSGEADKKAAPVTAAPAVSKAPAAQPVSPQEKTDGEEAETVPEEWAPSAAIKLVTSKEDNKSAAECLAGIIEKYSGQKVSVQSVDDTGAELKKAGKDGLALGLVSFSELGFPKEGSSLRIFNIKPLCAVCKDPYALAVREIEDRFTSLDKLKEYCDGATDPVRISVCGAGSASHAAAQILSDALGIRYTGIEKESTEKLYESLLSGECDLCAARLSELAGHEGLKTLAILSDERMDYKNVSDIPTLAELGYESADMPFDSLCVVLPAGASEQSIAFYEEVLRLALIDPEYLNSNNHVYELWHSMSDTNRLAQQWSAFGKDAAKMLENSTLISG